LANVFSEFWESDKRILAVICPDSQNWICAEPEEDPDLFCTEAGSGSGSIWNRIRLYSEPDPDPFRTGSRSEAMKDSDLRKWSLTE